LASAVSAVTERVAKSQVTTIPPAVIASARFAISRWNSRTCPAAPEILLLRDLIEKKVLERLDGRYRATQELVVAHAR
jgi:hypothetical protein